MGLSIRLLQNRQLPIIQDAECRCKDRAPLATAITRVTAAAAETPADLDQLLGERYPGEQLADEFDQRCCDARTLLRQMTHMGN